MTGQTSSTDFPTTPGAFQPTSINGGIFVTKLKTDGSGLVYSSYLEGANFQDSFAIAVDSTGHAYVTSKVGSSPGFPTTPGAFQTAPSGGNNDAFLTKFSSDGSALDYSTYLGGTYHPAPGVSQGNGIAVDSSGNAYVTGGTTSGNFPLTGGAFQITNICAGCTNAFVTKFTADGSGLDYSTYLGGTASPYGIDSGRGIAVDSTGFAYVTGSACSGNFPTTPGAFKTTNASFCDVFATKLKTDGTGLVYSTYLGGNQPDEAAGIGVDSAGHAYVAGRTGSSNFPITAGAFQTTMRTIYGNAFVTISNKTVVAVTLDPGVIGTDFSFVGGDTCGGLPLAAKAKCVVMVAFTPQTHASPGPVSESLSYGFTYGGPPVIDGNISITLKGTVK